MKTWSHKHFAHVHLSISDRCCCYYRTFLFHTFLFCTLLFHNAERHLAVHWTWVELFARMAYSIRERPDIFERWFCGWFSNKTSETWRNASWYTVLTINERKSCRKLQTELATAAQTLHVAISNVARCYYQRCTLLFFTSLFHVAICALLFSRCYFHVAIFSFQNSPLHLQGLTTKLVKCKIATCNVVRWE